jgi:hypothetical protein
LPWCIYSTLSFAIDEVFSIFSKSIFDDKCAQQGLCCSFGDCGVENYGTILFACYFSVINCTVQMPGLPFHHQLTNNIALYAQSLRKIHNYRKQKTRTMILRRCPESHRLTFKGNFNDNHFIA